MEQNKVTNSFEWKVSNPIIRLGLALSSLLVFYLLYRYWLIPQGSFLKWYTEILAKLSAIPIRWFGYDVKFLQFDDLSSTWLRLNDQPNVEVGYACNGFNLIFVFGIFLFMFRGSVKMKIIYFLFGYVILNLANILRIAALSVNYYTDPVTMEFNHKYTYTIVIYSMIGGLWFLWLKKFADRDTPQKEIIA